MLTVLQSSFVPGNRKKCELIPRGRNPYATRETVPHIHQTKQETGRRLHQDKAGLLTPRRGPGSQRGQGVLSQLPGKAIRCPAFQAQFSTAGPLIKTLKQLSDSAVILGQSQGKHQVPGEQQRPFLSSWMSSRGRMAGGTEGAGGCRVCLDGLQSSRRKLSLPLLTPGLHESLSEDNMALGSTLFYETLPCVPSFPFFIPRDQVREACAPSRGSGTRSP